MRLVLMGPPGAGKGTQATALAQRSGVVHISTGDLFRAHVRDRSDLGRQVQRHLDAGEYVPDEITNAMVASRLEKDDARAGFILDGFPRTVDQVGALDQMLSGSALDRVLHLAVDTDELVPRLLPRAATDGRSDDTEDVVRRRQHVYVAETAPLLDVYAARGLLVEVDGAGDIGDVGRRIDDAVSQALR